MGGEGKRIFIVEDEQIALMVLQACLARLGHQVVGHAASGGEALKRIKAAKPDLIMSDIKLEGDMDGIDLADAVHNQYGIPVIFVTGYSDKKVLNRVKASSACGFILKPFSDDELQATIDLGLHEYDLEIKLNQALNAIKQSEEHYRSLFDDAPVGYHEIDLKGNLARVNRTELKMLGYTESEMIGRPVWDFVEEHETVREAVMGKLGAGKISARLFERNYLRRNGRSIPVLINDCPIRDAGGKLLGIRSTIMDISSLKEAEAKTASFFAITEKSVIGIVVASLTGEVRYFNPAAEELLGLRLAIPEKSKLKSDDIKDALPVIVEKSADEIDQAEYARRIRPVIGRILKRIEDFKNGSRSRAALENHGEEIEIALADGESGIGEVRVAHTAWEGELAYLISIYDITERKKTEEELKSLDVLKTEFISTVSHELRTPLSITKEGVSLVLDGVPGAVNEKQSVILTAARNNIDRLARIIDDLLDISRMESGKIGFKRELINIAELVKSIVAGFELRAKERKLVLQTDFSANEIKLYADHDKIIQIFTNLISNALKFTEKGGVKISVKELKDNVKCVVADTGVGISENDLPRVFGKFQQFNRSVGPGEKGTGLGLSIVKGLVDLHQGAIRVESKPGVGSKFIFVLPKLPPSKTGG
ncbi:MAG: PAS domain S-box protein [Kiritimatiellae bacterium]|nr:PAS domain S-box protein [Kiritimatiellia bacterium]